MSDSSDDEDLSRFRDAVDNSFTNAFNSKSGAPKVKPIPAKSERYLEEASHYNDVKVPEVLQKKIAAKVSEIIGKNIKFVNVEIGHVKKRKIKGGIKLFTTSQGYLSCEVEEDTYTAAHNAAARALKNSRADDDHDDKIKAVAVSPEHILSKEDTKFWKSRRKEKLFKYKKKDKNSKVLVSVD